MKNALYLAFLIIPLFSNSQQLDSTFGTNGILVEDFYELDNAKAIKILPGGRILISGDVDPNSNPMSNFLYGSFMLGLDSLGSHDPGFGTLGKVFVDTISGHEQVWDLEFDAINNKIFLPTYGNTPSPSGNHQFTVTRHNLNGDLDSTYGNNGYGLISKSGSHLVNNTVSLNSLGEVFLAGRGILSAKQPTIGKLDANGFQDSTFGVNGVTTLDQSPNSGMVEDIVVQTDGKILVVYAEIPSGANWDIYVTRLNQDGSLDSSYGHHFLGSIDIGNVTSTTPPHRARVIVQADGKALVSSNSLVNGNYGWTVSRLNVNGGLDFGFGVNGQSTVFLGDSSFFSTSSSIVQQDDGKIVQVGTVKTNSPGFNTDATFFRYNPDGSIDNSFGVNGLYQVNIGQDDFLFDATLDDRNRLVATGVLDYDDIIVIKLDLGPFGLPKIENSLSFDGANDYAQTSNASSYVSGSSRSISLWVKPENTGSSGLSGIAGFNDATFGTFMIRQNGPNTVKAFFGPSSSPDSISFTGLTLNSWNHLALTQTASRAELFHNGKSVGFKLGSYNLSGTTSDLYLGSDPQIPNSNFLGSIDEFGLYSKDLSVQEIQCLINQGIDTADPALEIYYDFNIGVQNGNNSSITSLIDVQGNLNASLNNFSLQGTGSNFSSGKDLTHEASELLCTGDTLTFGAQQISSAGIYTETFSTNSGCDSLVQLTVSLGTSFMTSLYDTICQGDTLIFAGQIISGPGVYWDSLSTISGCDSLTQLTVNMGMNYLSSNFDTICPGDTLVFAGDQITVPGVYWDSLSSQTGCDSLIQLTVNWTQTYYDTIIDTICRETSYIFPDGSIIQSVDSSMSYTSILTGSGSCDSIIHTILDVRGVESNFDHLFWGLLHVYDTTADSYLWYDCSSGALVSNMRNFMVTFASYYQLVTIKDGCADTSQCIYVNPAGLSNNFLKRIPVKPNPTTGEFSIDNSEFNGRKPEKVVIQNSLGKREELTPSSGRYSVGHLKAGMYILIIENGSDRYYSKLVKQ